MTENQHLDPELVQSLLGKIVLVGITYCDSEGNPQSHKQFYGSIKEITETHVLLCHPESGEEFSLPPDFSSYKKAEPGEYRMRDSGEVVVNPDLLTTWTCQTPNQ